LAFTLNNVIDFFGQMSAKKAIDLAPSVALVTVVGQTQSFFAVLIGGLLTFLAPHVFHEDVSRKTIVKKILGAAVMFCGVALLLLG
jgi:hypothetical protein